MNPGAYAEPRASASGDAGRGIGHRLPGPGHPEVFPVRGRETRDRLIIIRAAAVIGIGDIRNSRGIIKASRSRATIGRTSWADRELPSPAQRWTVRRKPAVIEAVRGGRMRWIVSSDMPLDSFCGEDPLTFRPAFERR